MKDTLDRLSVIRVNIEEGIRPLQGLRVLEDSLIGGIVVQPFPVDLDDRDQVFGGADDGLQHPCGQVLCIGLCRRRERLGNGLGMCLLRCCARAFERLLGGEPEPGERALAEIVDGARLHEVDCKALVHRCRDDDPREIRVRLAHLAQGRQRIEARNRSAGNDQIRNILGKRGREHLLRRDAPGGVGEPPLSQLNLHLVGIIGEMLEDIDPVLFSCHR